MHSEKTRLKKCMMIMVTRKMVPITGRVSSCLALALSILLSSLAHHSSSLSCVFFFFSGSHPNSISYQVTNALSVSRGFLFLKTFSFFFFCIFFVLLLALSFSRLIISLSFLCSSVSEALFAFSFSFLSEHSFGFFFVHAKAALAYSRNE